MRIILAIVFGLVVSACGNQPTNISYGPKPNEDDKLLVDHYQIGVDDEVQVNVWKNPDLSISVPVRPDGMISVPLVGEVKAGGRTPLDVADEITQQLGKFIRDPQVSVILVNLRSHEYLSRVRVTGAVRTPISINYRQGMTVLDVILTAGGVNEFASANSTKLYRKIDGQVQAISINLQDILTEGDLETNYALKPGDILTVPERIF